MKRKVTIDKNGYKSTGIWGYVGEQNITDIEIVLPDELVPCDFCIAIITNAGRMELTDKLEIIDGKVNVIVPLSCTAAVGKITVQVVGYVMDESEEIYAIGKTAEFEGKIKASSTGEMVSDSAHVPLLERIWAKIQSWADKIHTHDNYWSLCDLYCEASEAEQGGNNPFPILPDVVGVDRPTFRSNYLRYDSDGAVINKVEKKEENGSKIFRMYFNKGILDILFDVPPFVDIPVKEINEKTEIGLNGTGLELDLGVGAGGDFVTREEYNASEAAWDERVSSNTSLAEAALKVCVESSDSTLTLAPDKHYEFGEVESLTLNFAMLDYLEVYRNEYSFTFTSGTTPTVLTLPSSVQWANELTVEANKRYEISIVDNIGLWCAVDLAVSV